MPVEEQLVKITRTGHNSWDTVYLLNVSFSNLILPDMDHPPSTVYLRKYFLFSWEIIWFWTVVENDIKGIKCMGLKSWYDFRGRGGISRCCKTFKVEFINKIKKKSIYLLFLYLMIIRRFGYDIYNVLNKVVQILALYLENSVKK